MFGGGGGMNSRKMQQMMEQMGVDFEELDASEVVLRLDDGTELEFSSPEVNKIVAQGKETYQVVGDPTERDAGTGAGDADTSDADAGDAGDADASDDGGIPDADVDIVAQRTGADEETAREALEESGGDLAAAVEKLE